MRFLLLALLLAAQAHAATYYISKTGSDSNSGSQVSPWLTIGKAATVLVGGDTVIIGDGDYNEHVQESTSGAAGNLITYQAANRGMASLRAFRMSGSYQKIDGLNLNKFSGVGVSWGAAIRVESSSNNCMVTNCTIENMPYVIAHDFSFNSATQTITSASSDFVTAGFVVGSKVYLGASGATIDGVPLYYVNHDQKWDVASLTATTMTLTNGSATFEPDAGTGYWAFIRAGSTNDGFAAIECILSGGDGPDNLTVTNNTVTNWPGHAFKIYGSGHLIEGNTLTELLSFRAFQYGGSNHIFRRNVVRNCPNVLHYSITEPLEHPPGTGWFDYQVGMISGFTGSGDHQNVLFEENWFEDLENQMGRLDDQLAGAYDITFQRNVFIGVTAQFSGGRDGMKWLDNTFVRCGFGGPAPHVLQIGGQAPQQTGYELKRNLFVACAPPGETESQTRGFYGIGANAISPVTSENFVAGEELLGFASKSGFTEADGINGGDPVFYNILDPDGADDTPFTADDGLKVLANSPVAGIGGGALGVRPVSTGQPVAHFRVSSPNGWWEGIGEGYDPEWLNELPTTRGRAARPYNVPPAFVGVPLAVTFDASKSISGVAGATTNVAITNYAWNWGDGSAVTNTASTSASHTFTSPGDRTVTLTVTNSVGGTASYSSVYRFPGAAKRVPADYPTIQAAMDDADPGDTIIISAGTYTETLRTNVAGTAGNRITIEGEPGACVKQIYLEDPYWTVRNLKFQGSIGTFGKHIWIRRGAHFSRVEHCEINAGLVDTVEGITWDVPSTKPLGTDAASDCVVTDTEVYNILGTTAIAVFGARNTVENCYLHDSGTTDWFRVSGEDNVIRGNRCINNYFVPDLGNHPDFIQTLGLNRDGARNILVERNYVQDIESGGMSQLEGNGVPEITDWTFRNNVFVRVGNTSSCTIPNVRFINNTFFQCNAENDGEAAHPLTCGSRIYTRNNVSPAFYPYEIVSVDVPSGSLIPGSWYCVTIIAPLNPSTDGITYNGTFYNHDDKFLAVDGVTTYTETNASVILGKAVVNYAHGYECKNNAFLFCGDGGPTKGWYGVNSPYGAVNDTSFNGNFVAITGYLEVNAGTAMYPSASYNGGKFFEANGINGGNPGFVDDVGLDFRLLSTSLLIDSGVSVDGVPNDYNGNARPFGTSSDIGAFEFMDEGEGETPPTPPTNLSIQATNTTATTITVQ